jgi:diguanylate cyclase (GGDEF)-like protein
MDNLKDVNTRLGHAAGSRTLLEVSERVRGKIRKFDKLFRFGGDEFCIVLPETEWHGATEVAERVREAISGRPFLAGARGVPGTQSMTASFGIASFPLHARTKEELVQRADRAMQSVKTTTKDGIATAERRQDPDAPDDGDGGEPRELRLEGGTLAIAGGVLLALLIGAFQLGRTVERWSAPVRTPATAGTQGSAEPDAVDATEKPTFFDTVTGPGKEAEPSREARPKTSAAPPPDVSVTPGPWFVQVFVGRDRQAAEDVVRSLRARATR